jgi:hypothetical protein
MKRNLFSKFLLSLLFLTANLMLHAQQSLAEYTYIEPVLKEIIRSPHKHTHPHIPSDEAGTSTNWSGYVAATNLSSPIKNSVTGVHGCWTVPQLTSASATTYCSMWVGIDGFGNGTVEQIGTGHDWANGAQSNYAWFEMYPQYPYQISNFPVDVGDVISASVKYTGNNIFTLTIINKTKRVVAVVPTTHTISATAQRLSAEWIIEAPYDNGVLPLSDFSTVNFTNCIADINGLQGAINNPHWQNDALTMITSTGAKKATPSALSTGRNFSVTWSHE